MSPSNHVEITIDPNAHWFSWENSYDAPVVCAGLVGMLIGGIMLGIAFDRIHWRRW